MAPTLSTLVVCVWSEWAAAVVNVVTSLSRIWIALSAVSWLADVKTSRGPGFVVCGLYWAWASSEQCPANAWTRMVLDEVNGTLIQTRGSLDMRSASCWRQARLPTWGWVVLSLSFLSLSFLSDRPATDGDSSSSGMGLQTHRSRCCLSSLASLPYSNAGHRFNSAAPVGNLCTAMLPQSDESMCGGGGGGGRNGAALEVL